MESLTKQNNHRLEKIVEDYKRAMSSMVRSGKIQMVNFLLQDSQGKTDISEILEHMRDVNISEEEKLILQVHFCLASMSDDGREIIWNEFFHKKDSLSKTNWWEAHYSRSTFYRLKNKWVQKFLNLCAI